jgi:hypothetical protein
MEQQNSTLENNEDATGEETDVVDRNFTTSLLTDFIKINDAMDI